MNFKVTTIVAAQSLPVRKDGRLAGDAALYPGDALGVYAKATAGMEVLRVTCLISVISSDKPEPKFVLKGRIGKEGSDALFSSDEFEPMPKNETKVSVFLKIVPDGFVFLDETVTWELIEKEGGGQVGTQETNLQLCFLQREPVGAALGVSYEMIGQIRKALYPSGKSDHLVEGDGFSRAGYGGSLTDVPTIVNSVFARNPPCYDSYQGAPHFISYPNWNNITLYYTAYFNSNSNPNAICNCYDMAAVLQYSLMYMLSFGSQYCFMEPFGYLAQTDLIGRGQCNNPFYLGTGGPITIGETNNARTSFGNHAFLGLNLQGYAVIADACAGPHTGTETPSQYVAVATDGTTPIPPDTQRGTVNNIVYYVGVTNVTSTINATPIADTSNLLAFVTSVGYDHTAMQEAPLHFASLPDIHQCPLVEKEWNTTYEEVHPGYPVAGRHIVLTKGDASIDLNVKLAGDSSRSAHLHYLSLGSVHTMSGPIFEKGPETLGTSAGKFVADGYSRYIWVAKNIVFDLKAFNIPTDAALGIAQWLHNDAFSRATPLADEHLPEIRGIGRSADSVKPGEAITLSVECDENLTLFVDGDLLGLQIAEENPRSFKFVARRQSENRVVIYGVNPVTLLSCEKEIFVVVG